MSYQSPPPQRQGFALPFSKPFWVYVLLGFILAYYLASNMLYYTGKVSYGWTGILLFLGANYPDLVRQGEVWRFLTSMFLHANFIHLLFNSWALLIFGLDMERLYGRSRFVMLYVFSGLFGSLASFTFSSGAVSVGASGAIFGLIGMQGAYFFRYKDMFGKSGKDRLSNIGIILVINIIFGLSVSNIDNWAHFGGLASGAIMGYFLAPVYEVVEHHTTHAHVVDKLSPLVEIGVGILAGITLSIGTMLSIG
ncbi:MAG: hypothetical protein B6242_05680 [Anaerolineaceae bacterium 4572_78]|nr:MAG: hypothetical protein B6242_05680 [Anaerolineaceae bacterium 4572_78]